MKNFVRLAEPDLLIANWQQIGINYAERRRIDPGYSFQWPQIGGKKVNREILPILSAQTSHHCSYCDKYPLFRGDDSIDHFKPKADERFYGDVAKWENLYLACKHCQDSKKTQYNESLLRPDDINYHFNKYFTYNYNEHKIEPNPAASDEEKARAEETIRVFDLNHASMKICRRQAQERYVGAANPDLNDYNYRFIFE